MQDRYFNNTTAKEDREDALQKAWAAALPCVDCPVRDICRHANTFKRVNLDREIFDVRITCKRRESLRRSNVIMEMQ